MQVFLSPRALYPPYSDGPDLLHPFPLLIATCLPSPLLYRFSSLPAPSIPRTVTDLTSFYNQSYHSDESTDTASADRKLFFFERDNSGAIVPLQVQHQHTLPIYPFNTSIIKP